MRINYSYQNYPNCPRATEYSKSAEEFSATFSVLIGWCTLGAVVFFLIHTFVFFESYDWKPFLEAIGAIVGMGIIDFLMLFVRPNCTNTQVQIILLEESHVDLPIAEVSKALRKENRRENWWAFKFFFSVFTLALLDTVSLIATIKGAFFLYNHSRDNALPFLLIAAFALCVFSLALWFLLHKPATASNKPKKGNANRENKPQKKHDNANPSKDAESILYCRKCGAKLLPDSIFCAHCGTKVK